VPKGTVIVALPFYHFTEDCFEADSVLASQLGIKKRKRLKPGAVPTIFHQPSTVCTSEAKKRSLHKRTAADACPMVGDKEPSRKKRGECKVTNCH